MTDELARQGTAKQIISGKERIGMPYATAELQIGEFAYKQLVKYGVRVRLVEFLGRHGLNGSEMFTKRILSENGRYM